PARIFPRPSPPSDGRAAGCRSACRSLALTSRIARRSTSPAASPTSPGGSSRRRASEQLLPDLRESEPAAPAVLQHLAHAGRAQIRIAGEMSLGLAARLLEQAHVAHQIRGAEVGQARLAQAEQVTRPARFEIGLGDAGATRLALEELQTLESLRARSTR